MQRVLNHQELREFLSCWLFEVGNDFETHVRELLLKLNCKASDDDIKSVILELQNPILCDDDLQLAIYNVIKILGLEEDPNYL